MIDSKAELQAAQPACGGRGQPHHADCGGQCGADENRGSVLKSNPLLIQKIIAERLSDKLQIMMVPIDGKFFRERCDAVGVFGGGGE